MKAASPVRTLVVAIAIVGAGVFGAPAWPFGEAGPLNLRQMGHFFVGVKVSEPDEKGAVKVSGQSYVGFALPAKRDYQYPLVLIHGGGGQSSDWFSTVDGRDGWSNYFIAAGIDTYWFDRPGLGRSPSNPAYGDGQMRQADSLRIAPLASSEHWPGAEPVEGEFSREAWVKLNSQNPGVIAWLANATVGPAADNSVAAANLIELANRIGPVVLFAHSAGVASTISAVLGAPAGKVAGVLLFEGGVNFLSDANRAAATWDPALPANFATVEVDGCAMQPEGRVSVNRTLKSIPITIIRTEHGNQSDEQFTCAVRQLRQMGVNAKFIQLADNGFPGGGHFMLSDTNSGEIAQKILLPIIGELMGKAPLPASWKVSR